MQFSAVFDDAHVTMVILHANLRIGIRVWL